MTSVSDTVQTSSQAPALVCRGLRASISGRVILDGIDLELSAGRSLAIMGPSGSGKTTLLNCIAGLHPVDDGTVDIADLQLSGASERRRARARLERIGMVFQFGELLQELTVIENVSLPLRLRGEHDASKAERLLEALGLADRIASHPAELSGGEVQRVAIARALVGSPTVLLADEPTGALDEDMSRTVCELLVESARHADAALLVATHDPAVAQTMEQRFRLREGKLRAVA